MSMQYLDSLMRQRYFLFNGMPQAVCGCLQNIPSNPVGDITQGVAS